MFVEVLRGRGVILLRFQKELEVRERSGRGLGGVRESSGRGPGKVFRGFWWFLGGFRGAENVLNGFM